MNTNNNNAATNVNNAVAVPNGLALRLIDEPLPFGAALLTEKELDNVDYGWDGESVLRHGVLPKNAVIAVHSGEFHADDVVSAVLLAMFAGVEDPTIIRTRDAAELEKADIRADVGEGLFDHHGPRAVKGVAACTRIFQLLRNSGCFGKLSKYTIEELKKLVAAVASVDTATPDMSAHWLTGLVQNHNRWGLVTHANMDDLFRTTCGTVYDELEAMVTVWEAAAKAESAALTDIAAAKGGEVVVFTPAARPANCKELIYKHAPQCVYFVSPESENDWRVLCAADPTRQFADADELRFNSRRLIPEKFRSLRDGELDAATGLTGSIFCHQGGFIAGFKTRDAAVRFAELCLK